MSSSRSIPPLLSLRVFEAVARHLSFTAAAEELHVTQSAVSHHIKKLEEELGRRLFERRVRAVALTSDGEAYFEHVHAAFDLLRRGTDAMRAPRHAAGTLTVGLLASFATRWLAPRLRDFHAAYPDVDVRLRPDIALADVSQGDVDVAIRYGRGVWSGVQTQKLMPERLSVVGAPELIAAHGPFTCADDLLRLPILYSHSKQPFEWDAWTARFGVDLSAARAVHLHDYNIVVEAALAGQGAAMGRHRLIAPQLASGALVPVFPEMTLDDSEIGWWLVTRPGPRSEAANAFCDWLIAVAENEGDSDDGSDDAASSASTH
ncbi:transcriptional regulator GcvA [Paraburkholderia tropica]|uniref:transcriptional regulator GcvA n=1 Tax=Paraburkholderia tropica TaxID=92647 RepID=UPI002ABDD743|nr:transcriptional regulator GcvA [Paraburkholderia tropica]